MREVVNTDDLATGAIVRRVSDSKDQQGVFVKYADDGASLILADVIDLIACEYTAEFGVLRHELGDRFFINDTPFNESPSAENAMQIIRTWTLFQQHPDLQAEIQGFVQAVYAPEQLLEWKRNDGLRALFVPIQQKFKIGRFLEKPDPGKVMHERFQKQLAALGDGDHVTYVAFAPPDENKDAFFYSIGTKPHQETVRNLEREPFAFKPNHGGHIKFHGKPDEEGEFITDAGSNHIGVGIHTSLSTAERVTDALKRSYPEFKFTPVAGRGAFGAGQSY